MDQSQQNTTNPLFTSYQIMMVVLLALLQFTIVLDFMILAPLGDFLMKSLNITPQGFGIVVSSYAFSAGISGILAAGFADRYDRKKILIFFYSGFILGTLGCALATTHTTLLIARTLTGLFGGVIGAVSLAIIADIFSPLQRGRVMGFVQMAFAASQILGIPIGLYLANLWDWHSVFLMIVILSTIILVVILIKVKPIDKHLALQSDKNPFHHLWHAVAKPSYQTGFIATALMSIGSFMLMPFSSAFLINNIKITHKELPLVFMFTGISSIIFMPIIGKLSDKVDKFMLFCIGSAIAVIMILIYTNLAVTPLWIVIVVNMVLFMGIMSRMIPATTLTMSIPDLEDRGAFMSINASMQQISGGIAAVFAGFIVTQKTTESPLENYGILGIIVSILIVICAIYLRKVSIMVKNKRKPVNQV
jgi:predicted MFS family arabinose efflux permease